ncbi:hypothetical protein AVEN_14300-1 [Araneus ventricosus]|uniref:Uncharacterized protein n=1 Tax=Araneus ventricosus TaxID=182803 RepID=A0A4Y2JYD7_ARAVE|nr:hypothetical protein AVEN_14300-1 [Araneus ventricosus]
MVLKLRFFDSTKLRVLQRNVAMLLIIVFGYDCDFCQYESRLESRGLEIRDPIPQDRYPLNDSNYDDYAGKQDFCTPLKHLKPNQISLEDGEANVARKDIINIFTDGSETEHGIGAAFCVLTNDMYAYQWSAKLKDNNTVFQAELTALHEAVIYASHLPNHNTSKIHVDNR